MAPATARRQDYINARILYEKLTGCSHESQCPDSAAASAWNEISIMPFRKLLSRTIEVVESRIRKSMDFCPKPVVQ